MGVEITVLPVQLLPATDPAVDVTSWRAPTGRKLFDMNVPMLSG
jgi:hypothetical protein